MRRFHISSGNIENENELETFFQAVLKTISADDSISVVDRKQNTPALRMLVETNLCVLVCGLNNVISEMHEDLLNMRSGYVNLSAPAEWKYRGRDKTVATLAEMENYLCQRAQVIVCAGQKNFCDRVKVYVDTINHIGYTDWNRKIISQR